MTDDNSGSDGSTSDESEDLNESVASISSNESSEEASEEDEEDDIRIFMGKDGTQWRLVTTENGGRFASQNVFRAKPGPTNYCRNVEEPIDSLRLFFDDGVLRFIRDCTVEYAHLSGNESFTLSLDELDAFIGLLYLRGAMSNSHFPYDTLWSNDFGCEKFKKTMSRNRFREIKKYIRFDERLTRSERLKRDKYALMSSVHTRVVENFQRAYVPHESLTGDEQLYPTKSRCAFRQYMSHKPDKFGIKNWLLVEVQNKYCLNIIPYLGKDDTRKTGLGEHVVMSLMEPYLNKGYNICTDNFFTNVKLADNLVAKSTSIVGTIRENKRELPPAARSKMALHDSKFFQSGQCTLVTYQAKKNKAVHLLSTMHRRTECDGAKKKPTVIHYYNHNKCGVDVLDSMVKSMTTKIGTRRWPLAVFFNLLDIAGVNSWIVFKKKTSSEISRREFLFKLGEQLTAANVLARSSSTTLSIQQPQLQLEKRANCKILVNCQRNRASLACAKCDSPMCGPCQATLCVTCFNKMLS